MPTEDSVGDTLQQVTEEAARCLACDAKIDFMGQAVPYIPQPDDVKDGHMKVADASIVMSGDVDGIVCDAACLKAWEEA